MTIEKNISQFIDSQFPSFYQEDGPEFIAFTKAYYEWLEIQDRYRLSFTPDTYTFSLNKKIIKLTDPTYTPYIVETNKVYIDVIGTINFAEEDRIYQIDVEEEFDTTVSVVSSSKNVVGVGTAFETDFSVNDYIKVGNEVKKVVRIISDTTLVVNSNWSEDLTNYSYIRYELSNTFIIKKIIKNSNPIGKSRNLLEYRDIDKTLDLFIIDFKQKYLNSIPSDILVNKRFLTKHILDLYRTKGTKRAYELLFRIIFNEDIEVYLPGEDIFKPSDAKWEVPKYIEVNDNRFITSLVGKEIYGSSSGAKAVVESTFRKIVNRSVYNVIYLSNLRGQFLYSEAILCSQIPEMEPKNSPIVIGSLSSVSITNGGANYEIGDLLNVEGSGVGGIARVAATRDENGKVTFTLINGGSGFSVNADVIIEGGGGSGATFQIGGLVDKEVISISDDDIDDYDETDIESITAGVVLTVSDASKFANAEYISASVNVYSFDVTNFGTIQVGEKINTSGNTANGIVNESYGSYLTLTDVQGTISAGDTLTGNISSASVLILTNYGESTIEANGYIKLANTSDNTLTVNSIFTFTTTEIIDAISVSNGGIGYVNSESITFTGGGGSGGLGYLTTDSNGTIVAVDLTETGSGYTSTPSVDLSNTSGSNAVLLVTTIREAGRFLANTTITGSLGNTDVIDSVQRLTDWGFATINIPDDENLDSLLQDVLRYHILEIGTISYLKNINPGEGYSSDPTVTIIERDVYDLHISDGHGGEKGFNAVVHADAGTANGIVTAIAISDSGVGYKPLEQVYLSSPTNPVSVYGRSVIDKNGVGTGTWRNTNSFTSSNKYLQDSDYYQDYSYEIISTKAKSSYEKLVNSLIHPSGTKMFGKFTNKDYLSSGESELNKSYMLFDSIEFNANTDVSSNSISIASNPFVNNDVVLYTARSFDYTNTTPYEASFNANTDVNESNEFISITSNPLVNNDIIYYSTKLDGTVISGLSNASYYYVVSANSTGIKLASTYGGSAIDLTKGLTEEHIIIKKHPSEIDDLTDGNEYYVVGANNTTVKLSLTSNGDVIELTPGFNEIHTLSKIVV